ncbi:hypothetical protein B0H21DRAFT_734929 [Amylocystis lapponica]|nr:hypothetical protein B0H21DRAFT_734929 [Amylocystis lapponica]
MDIASLRSEIKAWERDFRNKHARDPTIHEIKAQPAIAAKYKLYKSLSKSTASAPIPSSSAISSSLPITPPRPQSASLVAKTRAVRVDPPTETVNPFSPVKNKSRRVPSTSATDSRRTLDPARPNPFTTPTKVKHSFPPQPPRVLSAEPSTAVTRARKRLRGEPVSPSPVKEKRARVLRTLHASSGDESGGDSAAEDATFITDTPVKPPPGGKPFRVLFDEATPRAPHAARAKTAPHGRNTLPALFADRRPKSRALSPSSSGDEGWGAPKLRGLLAGVNGHGAKGVRQQKMAANGRLGVPKVPIPGRDDLWSAVGPAKGRPGRTEEPPARPVAKRPLPDDEPDAADERAPITGTNTNTLLRLPLLPPSPPPRTRQRRQRRNACCFERKKAKLLAKIDGQDGGEFSEDDEDDNFDKVKMVEHTWHKRHDATGLGDSEPEWDWGTHAAQDGDNLLAHVSANVEVRLPEDLRRMLALSPTRAREIAEEESRLVQGLLYGRRAHYDAGKGGEVWGTEEEWEGEGVPWEVGEL